MFRRILFWLHLAAGCVAGLVILLMSATGVMLTYEKQMLAWLDRPPSVSTVGARLPVSGLAAAVREQRPELATSATLTLRSDPASPAEVRAGREEMFYVDPYSGKILAKSPGNSRAVFQKITAWHRWMGVEGPGRATARAITGACNLCFLFIVVSGACLWLPRRWSRPAVCSVLLFRLALSGKARDFNWHNVFGIWALVPLFFVVLTALPMSYSWANELLYTWTGTQPPPSPARGTRRPEGGGRRERGEIGFANTDLDKLWNRAQNQTPGWRTITARLTPEGGTSTFTIDAGNGGQPQKRSTLTLHSATADVVRLETFADAPAGRRLRMWSRFVHTGEYYGVAGQTIAGLASFAGVMLVWTGKSLALRRFFAWRARRGRAAAADVPEPVGAGAQDRV